MSWLAAQVSTGIKDLPRNGAWVLSKVVGPPDARGTASDAARRMTAAAAEVLPGSHTSVEARIRRAEQAVAKAKSAEQEALADARDADSRAETARAIAEENRQRMRDATREGKQEVERRTHEANRSLEYQVEQERERAGKEVADRLEQLTAEMQAQTDESREDAEEAARRAQERIAQAHEQMAAARTLAAEATQAAQEAADQARQQAKAVAEQAEQDAGAAERVVGDARGTEDLLATETARAVQAEREYDVPERLDDHTKAELLDIAYQLQIQEAAKMTKSQLVQSIRKTSRTKS